MTTKSYSGAVCKLNSKTGEVILFCEECSVPLAITRNMSLFCPRCARENGAKTVNVVMCCLSCKYPLSVPLGRESYCETCNSHPGADDRFFKKIEDL